MQYLRQFCKRYDQSSTVSILRHRLVPPTNPVSQRRHLLPELPSWTSKKKTGSRHNRRTRLPSTIYSALLHTEKEKGRPRCHGSWMARPCLCPCHSRGAEENWSQLCGRPLMDHPGGEKQAKQVSSLIKKREEPNSWPLDPRQKFMHLYTWIIPISAD